MTKKLNLIFSFLVLFYGFVGIAFANDAFVSHEPEDSPVAQTKDSVQQEAHLRELVKRSPFVDASQTKAEPKAAAPKSKGLGDSDYLSIHSLIETKKSYVFSIHDSRNNESHWIGLKEAGSKFYIESYDPETQSVFIRDEGRAYLKESEGPKGAPPVDSYPGSFSGGFGGSGRSQADEDAELAELIRLLMQ